MTNYKKLISLLVLFTFSNVLFANSTGEKYKHKERKTISLKCDVLYIGGKVGIHYHHGVSVKDKSSFKSKLLRMKLPSKKKIYKVNECVGIDEKFKNTSANNLEKDLAR